MTKELREIELELARFMRGNYILDEVGNGKDKLKFRYSGKTILTLIIKDDCFNLLIIYGKAERDKFQARRNEFSKEILDIYDNTKDLHDGKWMLFKVSNLITLKEIEPLITIKKKPNRKPFSRENAIYSKCGMRCDLCAHYNVALNNELSQKLINSVNHVYYPDKNTEYPGCPGCGVQEYGKPHPCMSNDWCDQLKCAKEKAISKCTDCKSYPCSNAVAGYQRIEPRSISADDVTWGILPYVAFQYGN